MLQQEVAQRLAAQPGNKNYGRLSVMVQYFCQVAELFTVAPEAFYPIPKVTSTFISLIPHPKIALPAPDLAAFAQIVKLAFSHRRKTIQNNLKNLISKSQLINLNIDPTLRPEQLTITDFVKLSLLL